MKNKIKNDKINKNSKDKNKINAKKSYKAKYALKIKQVKRSLALWVTGFVFLCLLSSSILTVLVAGIIEWSGNQLDDLSTLIYLLIALAVSCLIGTIIASILSNLVTKQASVLNESINKVANGDFNIELETPKNKVLKETIENFNKMVKDLKSVAMLRNDFISNFSHEFKTPIVSINGFAEVLRDNKNLSQEQREEYLQIIIDESARLSKLSQNTLLLSKLETQSSVLDKNKYFLDEQIRQIVLLLHNELANKNINIKLKLNKLPYFANENLFHHVWLNIINNALKYAKSKITITSVKQENQYIIKIEDDGLGVNQETLKHIFEKYYQGENSSVSSMGNGLGLSIAQKIIHLHNGKIEAQSIYGKNMIFLIYLPLNNVVENKK